jgi:hypothetical protein
MISQRRPPGVPPSRGSEAESSSQGEISVVVGCGTGSDGGFHRELAQHLSPRGACHFLVGPRRWPCFLWFAHLPSRFLNPKCSLPLLFCFLPRGNTAQPPCSRVPASHILLPPPSSLLPLPVPVHEPIETEILRGIAPDSFHDDAMKKEAAGNSILKVPPSTNFSSHPFHPHILSSSPPRLPPSFSHRPLPLSHAPFPLIILIPYTYSPPWSKSKHQPSLTLLSTEPGRQHQEVGQGSWAVLSHRPSAGVRWYATLLLSLTPKNFDPQFPYLETHNHRHTLQMPPAQQPQTLGYNAQQ